MAEHRPRLLAQTYIAPTPTTNITTSVSPPLKKLQQRVSNSKQLFGVLTLVITVAISLILTGLTVVIAILGLILFSPLIIVLSPIWVPACAALFLITAGFLSTCGIGLVTVAGFTWMFLYFRGHHKPGSDPVYEPVSHVGGYYLQSKVVDYVPGV